LLTLKGWPQMDTQMAGDGADVVVDCAIVGGGPAGLQAALVLGRARRSVLLFDDNRPRNAVTQESHGFLTRDGITPGEFRRLAQVEVSKYPSVALRHARITEVSRREGHDGGFALLADEGNKGTLAQARTIILATGLHESLPAVPGLKDYYGKSLFSCPYCDGWELRDKPLVVIAEEGQAAFHMAKVVWNWSGDLLLCTNGHTTLSPEQKATLQRNGIQVVEDPITALVGADGRLERIILASHGASTRQGGFVVSPLSQASPFGAQLGCEMNASGAIVTDEFGRTSVPGVYAAGDASIVAPAKLIVAAAAGSRAAVGVNTDLTDRAFR
jgi:thioredoxin reductase